MASQMFNRVAHLVLAALLLTLVPPVSHGLADETEPASLVLFWGDGCPHCERERQFLEDLAVDFPELVIHQYEVWYDAANRQTFVATMEALGRTPRAVPTTILGPLVWEGFSDEIAADIRVAVAAELAAPDADPVVPATNDVVDLPLLGEVDVSHESLLVSTLAIGFVDGFNPCSLWVLSMLLALVLHTKSRKRVLAVGAVFLAVTTLLYGFYIAGLYSVLSYVSYVTWIRVVVALVALGFGLLSLKDYFWFGQGPSMGIATRHKPRLYQRMRAVAAVDRPLPEVLGGTAVLAVGVSLIETPCTAGFPLMWSNLLTAADVSTPTALWLFGVYMSVFLIDELAVFFGAVAAMRITKLQERHGRILRLAGGTVMVALAAVMLLRPALMESVNGVLAVLAGAAALSLVVLAAGRLRGPRVAETRARSGRA